MAQIQQQTVVIRLSKLVKGNAKASALAPADFESSLEAVAAELLGDDSIIVEVESEDAEDDAD